MEPHELREITEEGRQAFQNDANAKNPYNHLTDAMKFEAWNFGFNQEKKWGELIEMNEKY